MTYLIDTDWLADYLRAKQEAISLLTALSGGGLAISLVTYGEIYEGIYYGGDAKRHEIGFRSVLRELEVISLHKPIMKTFARVRGDLRARGLIIGDMDLLIAATALHYDLVLVTRNLRHFQRIAALQIYGFPLPKH